MKVNQSTPIQPIQKTTYNFNILNQLNQLPATAVQRPSKGVRLLGIIEAGFASPVDEQLADIMHIEDYVIRDKNASFMLLVEDNSLEHRGICENDLVIFERGASPVLGDLVVILTLDGYKLVTLSRLTSDEVVGVVVSVIRKYK